MIFMVQPTPVVLQPNGKPPPPPQVVVPWAECSPAVTDLWQPGPGAILPPVQPEIHFLQWPQSAYGDGMAPPLQPQAHPPRFPSSTSLLDELVAAMGIPDTQAPSVRVAADAGAHPALPGAPSFLGEGLEASGVPDLQVPSVGAASDSEAHSALPGVLQAKSLPNRRNWKRSCFV